MSNFLWFNFWRNDFYGCFHHGVVVGIKLNLYIGEAVDTGDDVSGILAKSVENLRLLKIFKISCKKRRICAIIEALQKRKGSAMKFNLTIRSFALLLCLVTLFTVSCVAPVTTNPPATSDDTTTPPTSDNPPESTFPENGEETIVTKTIKMYQTAEAFEDITVAHYEGTPEILLIDTETMCEEFINELLGGKGPFTYEETDTTLTITRANGAYCKIDFVEDTMYFNDFDMFTAFGFGNMADMLDSKYVDSEGNSFYFQRTDSLSIAGLPLVIDLAARNIPLDIYEGKKYVPFQTFNDIFLSPFYHNFAYNSKDLFSLANGRLDPSIKDAFYSIEPTERSEALIEYTVNELCLFMDLFYGLQDEHGVAYGFEVYLKHAGLWDDLTSPDASKSSTALASLMGGYLADKHSGANMASPYTGSSEVKGNIKINSSMAQWGNHLVAFMTARSQLMPDGIKGYFEVGNTAYITFDGFTINDERLIGYDENSTDLSDTLGLIIYAHSQITRENSPIENVVLDLSCNMGGAVDAAVYVTAWMIGYCDFHMTNPITGSFATSSFKVDVNLDGKFDDSDTVANKNLYCITSPISFSCGNLVPSLLKESGKVTMLGNTSGGGACSVQFTSLADGSFFQISSPHHICVVSNGAYYTVDRGVEPHYFFGKPESYYDREALTDFINDLK